MSFAEGSRPGGRKRLGRRALHLLSGYGMALLLLLVAARQITLVKADNLSRWRGGGFGMYSEFHPADYRLWVSIVPVAPSSAGARRGNQGAPARFHLDAQTLGELRELESVSRRYPSVENLEALGRRVAGSPDLQGCKEVVVQLWAPRLRAANHALGRTLVVESVVAGRAVENQPCGLSDEPRPDAG